MAAAVVILTSAGANAGIPTAINYQGVLTVGDTALSPGVTTMRFRIYDSPVAGAVLWESFDGDDEYVNVNVQEGGRFNYLLGSDNPLPGSLVNYDSLWLAVRRGSDEPEMMPRTPLVSVMYAFRSAWSDSAGHSDYSQFAEESDHARLSDSSAYAAWAGFVDSAGQAMSAKTADSALHSRTADTAFFATSAFGMHEIVSNNTFATTSSASWTVLATLNITGGEVTSFIMINSLVRGDAVYDNFAPTGSAYGVVRITIDGVEQFIMNPSLPGPSEGGGVAGSGSEACMTFLYAPTVQQKQDGFEVRVEGYASKSGGDYGATASHLRTQIWGL